MSNPVRESAKTEKGDESSPIQAVRELEWAGIQLGAVKCGQVHTLRNEAKSQLQENIKTSSLGLVKGSHTKIHS